MGTQVPSCKKKAPPRVKATGPGWRPAKHGGLGGWDVAGHKANAALKERFPRVDTAPRPHLRWPSVTRN